MKGILSRGGREALRAFSRARVLLAFDFDGTLAPIVSDPARAGMRAGTRRLLAALSRRYPCVVLSGRARSDVARRLEGSGVIEAIGNHGIEPWQTSRQAVSRVRRWRPRLTRALASLPGVTIEDKVHSLAVHYRASPRKPEARAAIRAAAARLGRVRLVGGKQVLNVLPAGAADKGAALREAMGRLGCEAAVYLGDDETDEDAFALAASRQVLAVRVGRGGGSRASYFLRSQREIDALLRMLLRLRPPSSAAAGSRARGPRRAAT